MRVVVLPRLHPSWSHYAIWNSTRAYMSEWTRTHKTRLLFVAPLNKDQAPPKYTSYDYKDEWLKEQLGDPSRVELIKTPMGIKDNFEQFLSTREIRDALAQHMQGEPYDAILNVRPAIAPLLYALTANPNRFAAFHVPVPIINWCVWLPTKETADLVPEAINGLGYEMVVATQIGLLYSALNVFQSKALYRQAYDTIRDWFTPSALRRWEDRARIVQNGVPMQRLLELGKRRVANPKPVVGYAGRLAVQKRWEDTCAAMDSLYKMGKVGECWVSTQTKPDKAMKISAQYPYMHVNAGASRDDWYELIPQIDIFLCLSRTESYGQTIIEALAGGAVVVYLKEPWMEGVVSEGYPFVCADKKELVQVAAWVADNLERAREMIAPHVQWTVQENDIVQSAGKLHALVEEAAENAVRDTQPAFARGPFADLVRELAPGLGARFPHSALLAAASKKTGNDYAKNNLLTEIWIRRTLAAVGYRDLDEEREPIYVPAD